MTKYDFMSPNVPGIRRSRPPNKAKRKFCRRAGMWVRENRIKGVSPDCGFSNPEPPNRQRSVYRMLNDRFNRLYIFIRIYIISILVH